MKKMLKRADGSTSKRGLWDNIRANKGSGKKPTKEMLAQEKKIKSGYKETGGPKSERVQNRSNKATTKSAEYKQKAVDVMSKGPMSTESVSGRSSADQARYDYEKYMRKSGKQESKASKLQEKADFLKAYGKKTGGASNWLMESKEIKFGGPTKKYQAAGFKGCVGETCKQVMSEKGTTYAGNGSNYTGSGAGFDSSTPRYKLNLVQQTEEEKLAGLENQAKYKAEAAARMAKKDYERYLRSGKGDFSTGMDPEMVKDKGVSETNFRSFIQKTGGKKKKIGGKK
jgi:hypothetical protein